VIIILRGEGFQNFLIGNADCEDMRFTYTAVVMLVDIAGISKYACMPAIPRTCNYHD
jgi:hypothetical protein